MRKCVGSSVSEPSGKLNGALAFVFCRPSMKLSFLCSYSLDVNEDGLAGLQFDSYKLSQYRDEVRLTLALDLETRDPPRSPRVDEAGSLT